MIAADPAETTLYAESLSDTLELVSTSETLGHYAEVTSRALWLLSRIAGDLSIRAGIPESAPKVLEGAVVTIGGAR